MKEFINRLLAKYNGIINELEELDNLCRTTLEEANLNGNYSEEDIALLMVFARDNHKRLQFAKAERELIDQY